MAHRSDSHSVLPPSETTYRTYGLLFLGGTWNFLIGEASLPEGWLADGAFDWTGVTLVSLPWVVGCALDNPAKPRKNIVRFACGSLLDPPDILRFACILRNIGREATERQRLVENWLWCLREPWWSAADLEGDDGNEDGEAPGDQSQPEDHSQPSHQGKRKMSQGWRRASKGGRATKGRDGQPSRARVHLVPTGWTEAKSHRVSAWVESVGSPPSGGYYSAGSDVSGDLIADADSSWS
jgi:hypothetical protein